MSCYAATDPRVKHVVCIEANPQLPEVILRHAALNNVQKKVKVISGMLAHREGEAEFALHEDFWASSATTWEGARKIKVKKHRFQDVLDTVKPTLILCDIEGGEFDLFNFVDLSGVKKILMEIHQETIGRKGIKHVFDILSQQGFSYDQHHSDGPVVTFSHVDRI